MRILLIGAVFFGLLGHAIHAQTTIVRSGEHETFSRLTLQLPKGATWDISQGQRSAILAIMNPKLGFDTSQVFERMPKTRLVGLSKNEKGDELRLEFGCDCELTWFTMARGLLVIDINDPENEPFQFRSALLPTGRLPYRFGGATILSQPEINATEPLLPNRVSQSRYEPTLPADPEGTPGVRVRRVGANENISERRLLEQIGRAANQGLLTPLVPLVPKVERVTRNVPESKPSSTSTEPILPINVNAATSIDLGLSQAAGAISNADNDQECVLVVGLPWVTNSSV